MNKMLFVPLLAITLAGCIDAGNLLTPKPGVGEYYTLDSEQLILCRGQSDQCHRLTLIASAQDLLQPVERAYGVRIGGPNYPLQLARTLIAPPGGQYEALPVGESGHHYRLPVNAQTDTAWEAISKAYNGLYIR